MAVEGFFQQDEFQPIQKFVALAPVDAVLLDVSGDPYLVADLYQNRQFPGNLPSRLQGRLVFLFGQAKREVKALKAVRGEITRLKLREEPYYLPGTVTAR